ncbi:hypothetical protein GCK72_018110 [Caenorhabditis remanei]|uniref:Cytochrome b5 n=2 Tax=Caenorhabditis remanei TaxID=31234 RepID=E3LPR8_CAERE|nr:hypothetical protein GCK72_018110 [Caenorhabditis remanei]EFP05382.1 hypothetical protein CRE_27009 [Caenorhabditis remanei]KAF1751556.1 hypothetical protein GCK72_018110 [Caenorhabditis remanei]
MSDAIFTRSEVSMHCGEDDCWIIVGNYVYDVTKFVDLHPGGPEILLEFAGGDATDAFESVGHSMCARMMLTKFKIGSLPEDERPDFVQAEYITHAKISLPMAH